MEQISPEQAGELQEKLKNMSPEQLKEFQKQQCIFCHIIEGKVQSKKIYEDDKALAILDINPANPGHILLIPKEHYAMMPLMPDDEVAYLFMVAKHLSNACLKALKADGTTILAANGIAAGQKAQHFMLHIIPRKEGDGLGLTLPEKTISESDLAEVKKRLKAGIAKKFGFAEEEHEEKPEEKKEEPAEEAKDDEKEPEETEEETEEEPAEEPVSEETKEKVDTIVKETKKQAESQISADDLLDELSGDEEEKEEEPAEEPEETEETEEEPEDKEPEETEEETEETEEKPEQQSGEKVDLDSISRLLG